MSTSKDSGFERKLDKNGQSNPKYVDLLEEDKPIAGQKFVCVSFVSPDKILKQKLQKYNVKREIYKVDNLVEVINILKELQKEAKQARKIIVAEPVDEAVAKPVISTKKSKTAGRVYMVSESTLLSDEDLVEVE